ncbi:spore protease YyaC [Clostridium sp. LBM24168]
MKNLENLLKTSLDDIQKPYKEIIFTCIGTDKYIWDSYGPIVGTKLKQYGFKVYGTLKYPMHSNNLELILKNIDIKNNLIVAVDAGLGYRGDVGKIFIKNRALKPGAGLNKNLPAIGDISITAIINVYGKYDSMALQGTRLSFVYYLALQTANAICRVMGKENKLSELL